MLNSCKISSNLRQIICQSKYILEISIFNLNFSKNSFFFKIRLSNLIKKCSLSSSSQPNIVDLSYDLNDKYNSSKALVIAHGLFASKASWRALARRINEHTKQKVFNFYLFDFELTK